MGGDPDAEVGVMWPKEIVQIKWKQAQDKKGGKN